MALDIGKAVLVRWKGRLAPGVLVKKANHGKSVVVQLDQGIKVQVKAERVVNLDRKGGWYGSSV